MNLKQQREAALKAARDLAEKVKGEGRGFTDDEQKQVSEHMAKADELARQIKSVQASDELMSRIASLGSGEGEKDGDQMQAKSLGEHFAKSVGQDGFHRLKSNGGVTVSAPEFKAETDVQTTPTSFGPVLTQVDRTVVHGFRRPVVTDLFGTGTLGAGTNAVTYFVEGAFEGQFTTVAEGAQKPQIHVADPTAVTDAAKKIAAWWDTSDEMIEDLDFWVSEINQRGLYQLSLAEEAQVLNGDGTGSNLLGVLKRSGIQTETQASTGDNAADTIFRALTKVQTVSGLSADAIVIHPTDYQALRLAKNGQGEYLGGGFFYAGDYGPDPVRAQPDLWGFRTIVSPAIAPKTVAVGAFKAATTLYRKGGVRVETTNSDLGKFTQNKVTTRIEERIALAVRVPSAICQVTLV